MKTFKRKLKEDAINTFLLTGAGLALGAGVLSQVLKDKLQKRADKKAAERYMKRMAKKNGEQRISAK